MGKIFAKVIQARRASPHKEEDVLQQFCDARYQVGCARADTGAGAGAGAGAAGRFGTRAWRLGPCQ
jgi:hypothetical protein